MTIVRTHYRYKRPPRKRKAVALGVPAIVARARKKRLRVSDRDSDQSAAPDDTKPPPPPPTNDADKPPPRPAAIVTAKRKRRTDGPLPMELPASRKPVKPVEREGDDYKRMKAAMARRLRGE